MQDLKFYWKGGQMWILMEVLQGIFITIIMVTGNILTLKDLVLPMILLAKIRL